MMTMITLMILMSTSINSYPKEDELAVPIHGSQHSVRKTNCFHYTSVMISLSHYRIDNVLHCSENQRTD
jgi:hypothetical protein